MKVSFRGRRIALSLLVAGASVGLIGAAQAQTKLEISVPWGPNEFHSLNAAAFAKRITEETKGQVQVFSRPGGELGVKATESVRAVAEALRGRASISAISPKISPAFKVRSTRLRTPISTSPSSST